MPAGFIKKGPWDKGANPKTAIFKYLSMVKSKHNENDNSEFVNFEIDKDIESKIMITSATDGFFKTVIKLIDLFLIH